MPSRVELEFTCGNALKAAKQNDLIIVIDVLRCTTSIITALANGAREVIPVASIEEAYQIRNKFSICKLAGELNSIKPEGFDFGNSPLEFVKDNVEGKFLVFKTTNGTTALVKSRSAKWVLLGSFLNAKAVALKAYLIAERGKIDISLILAGRKGCLSLEDFLCGGAIAKNLLDMSFELSDSSYASIVAFEKAKEDLHGIVMKGEHAKQLQKLGFSKDILYACMLNSVDLVPIYKEGIIKIYD